MASIDPAELARRLDSIVAKAGPAAPLLLFLASFLEYVFPPGIEKACVAVRNPITGLPAAR